MVILTLLDPQQQTPLRQWRFEQESLIRVGRSPDNHVVLSDPLVSRHHLVLRRLDTPELAWQVINHSTNGTFLDGCAITTGTLAADTLLQLARQGPRLRFQVLTGAIGPSLQLPDLPKAPAIVSPLPSSGRLKPCTHVGNSPNNLFCVRCGQPVRVEQTIRQYQVLRVLGKGGMGTTYLVWHAGGAAASESGRLLVLKEMNADMARIPKAQELFEREAATLKCLNHPGIPRFYDFFVEAGKKYLVMELVHGQDLEQRVRETGPVSPQQAITWMIQTCDVLEYLHNRPTPIIHRDIKPGNLLVRSLSNRVVVLDFGAVKAAGMPPGTRIGAEGYCAPEQTLGRPLPQSDLYAIGPTLVYLLTGENPRPFYRKTNDGYRFLPKGIAAISPRLQAVIECATDPRPRDRYSTAKELALALTNCLPK